MRARFIYLTYNCLKKKIYDTIIISLSYSYHICENSMNCLELNYLKEIYAAPACRKDDVSISRVSLLGKFLVLRKVVLKISV